MNAVLDWIAYSIAVAVAIASMAGVLMALRDCMRAVRADGFMNAWRDNWRYGAFVLVVAGTICFVIWRFER